MDFELEMLDLFASEYKWERDRIMNDVFLDEYFMLKDKIEKRNKQEYIKQINIQMLPHMDEKDRKKFLDDLQKDLNKPTQKTDFLSVEQAKTKYGFK
ncbi:hypothetical protein [Gracilibacillus saliphilus]|uniref:hypothetical protein n=1 Tax=Gracilibacillus saliphilus TaxID=543890 RepID=UPI001EE1674F|nr:hypothetical protein [Gracilibacillus saliphilus]